jgi:hypothetical protein
VSKIITEAEIIEQIKESFRTRNSETSDGDVMTMNELSEALGMRDKAARKLVRGMIEDGEVEVVWIRKRNMVGVISKVPAYKYIGS